MHTEKTCMFALRNKVRTAHIGCQHGFFDDSVRLVAGASDDFFNATTFIADDLRLCGFKINCPTLSA